MLAPQRMSSKMKNAGSGPKNAASGAAVLSEFGVHGAGRHGDVLFLAFGVGETKVDKLDLLVFDHLDYIGAGHRSSSWETLSVIYAAGQRKIECVFLHEICQSRTCCKSIT